MVGVDVVALNAELNKLKKQELIDLIINKLLPKSSTSDVPLEFHSVMDTHTDECNIFLENINNLHLNTLSGDTVIERVNNRELEFSYLNQLSTQKDLLIKNQKPLIC